MKVNTARLMVGISVGLIVIGFLLYSVKLIEPASEPQNLFLSNITDHQITLSWTTEKPTRGQILLSEDNKFPFLPIFIKKWEKDDGEKSLPTTNFYLTHQITIGDLKPNKTYYFRIYQGWKKMLQGQFTTGSTLSNILPPNPVYGQVMLVDKKTPAVGSLVYLEVMEASNSSALLSTLTNKDGRWSMDLSNLRTTKLDKSFKLATNSAEILIVDTGKNRVKAQTRAGKDKPWPNIILK